MKRFFDKVEKTESCWNWIGYITNSGYGQFRYHGKTQRAQRVSYEMSFGKIAEGLVIDHLCKNTKCVNPSHLTEYKKRKALHSIGPSDTI